MNKKLGLLVLVAVFALASMGMSYATDKYVVFMEPFETSDNEVEKDVGVVIAYPTPSGLGVTVSNAYPGYEAYVDFSFKNSSTYGGEYYYKGFDTSGYDVNVLDIVVSGIDSGVLYPDTVYNGRLTITILDGAEEDQSYSFGVDIGFSD